MNLCSPIWLASASARRRDLLAEAGVPVQVRAAEIDDGHLDPGTTDPRLWVAAMAYLKARWVLAALRNGDGPARGTVLAADTVCVHEGRVIGKPRDREHAAAILHDLQDDDHVTMTGVALIDRATGERTLIVDEAVVRVGPIDADAVDAYLDSEDWQGKAGAYNLSERIDAGWDITCDGDPTTVMGLPMQRLLPSLRTAAAVSS